MHFVKIPAILPTVLDPDLSFVIICKLNTEKEQFWQGSLLESI